MQSYQIGPSAVKSAAFFEVAPEIDLGELPKVPTVRLSPVY